MIRQALFCILALLPAWSAGALTLSEISRSAPWPGVVIVQYRTANPGCDVWVAEIDLCADHVRVEATGAPSAFQTAAAWGGAKGVQLATNGDFYRTGPQVYGDAVGGALRWPLDQTGLDPAYASDWYYEHHGWIAFGHDWVDFTHTEWVKNNAARFGLAEGFAPDTVAPAPPPGTISLVSGFPELVVEGQVITCPSPTDASCFPDRSDMRDRHPRTAMGLTADRWTFLLAVVDGRTAQSAGMYGAELADLMGQLGAFVAFNLDGGGSSQMWQAGQGTINNASGNNSGGGLRGVANHWGVFAGATSGTPQRPAHCTSAPPCQLIPPPGGTLESDGPCAWLFGDHTYWREEAAGQGGHLYWTNAWTSARPSEWAWWQMDFEAAGEYLLEVWVDATFGVFANTRYEVVADGVSTLVHLDQGAAAGWRELGAFEFAAGGGQHLAVFDNTSAAVPADQHITADAIRLTRLDPWCGDGNCEGAEDCFTCPEDCPATDEIPDNGLDDDCDGQTDEDDPPDDDGGLPDGGDGPDDHAKSGCGCVTADPGGANALLPLALLFALRQRRRRR